MVRIWGCRGSKMVDLIQDLDNFTAGNSFCGRFGAFRDKKRPQPGRSAYPAVNFDQNLGRGPNLGVPWVQNGRFDSRLEQKLHS